MTREAACRHMLMDLEQRVAASTSHGPSSCDSSADAPPTNAHTQAPEEGAEDGGLASALGGGQALSDSPPGRPGQAEEEEAGRQEGGRSKRRQQRRERRLQRSV